MNALTLVLDPSGKGHCLYSELIDLARIGNLKVKRISMAEFDSKTQDWQIFSEHGQMLFASSSREKCLEWEKEYFSKELAEIQT